MPYKQPAVNTTGHQWSTPFPLGTSMTPPGGAPIHPNVPLAVRSPRDRETAPIFEGTGQVIDLVVSQNPRAGSTTNRYFTMFDAINPYGAPPTDVTLWEIPAGTGTWYAVMWSRIEAYGYPNEHLNCYCQRVYKTAGLNKPV